MGRKKKEEIQESSIWKRANEDNPVLLSEFDLKGFMLKDERREANALFDFLRRQLQTSNIPKNEVRIFQMQIECISSWFNMGLRDLANEEYFELISELSINKSVGGFSSILNLGEVGANVVMQPGQASTMRMGYDQQYEEQREGVGSKIKRRLLGG